MTRIGRSGLWSALWLILPVLVLGAERTAVFEFVSIGVDEQSALAATQIFRNELAGTGKFEVIAKREVEGELARNGITDPTCNDAACAARYGAIVDADKAIIGSLTRLGKKITAEVTLIDVTGTSVLFSDHFPASSLDDLDNALRKLAGAVATGRKIESEATRFAISDAEARDPRRKKAHITSGASFGFGLPTGNSYAKADNLKMLVWSLRYEAGAMVVDNSVGITWGSTGKQRYDGRDLADKRVTVLPWDIGIRYLLKRESDFSPFVGAGLGLHFISSVDAEGETVIDGGTAPAVHLSSGVYGFQTYDFRLVVEAKYTVVFSDAFIGSGDTSQAIGISIGVSRRFDSDPGCLGFGCFF